MRNRTRAVLATATMAAGLTAWAVPASAIVTEIDDYVMIDGNGFDLGGSGWTGSRPENYGSVEWDQAWYGVNPTFIGRLHIAGDNDCARVRLISYDNNWNESGREFSDTKCAPDNDHVSWPIELDGEPGSRKITLTVQSLNAEGNWSNVNPSQNYYYGPTIHTSEIRINRATFDFGSGPLVAGSPQSPGTLTWTVAGGTLITPRLRGTLYLNDTENCARIRMRFTGQLGNELGVEFSDEEYCGENDELKTFEIDMAPLDDAAVDEVHVSIQEFDASPPPGAWVQVGATTAYLD